MPLTEIWARVLVVLNALPARAAAATAVLAVIGTEVVPLLPGEWPVKAAAWVAAAIGAIAAVVKVVARLTKVPAEAVGLILPEGQTTRVELVGKPWPAGHVHPGAETFVRIDVPAGTDPQWFVDEVRSATGGDVRLILGD